MDRRAYSFGRFQIDTQSRILLRDGERVPLPPKTADLLIALLEREGELVVKDELMKALWPDTFVEDNNLAKHIFQLRKTLGHNEHGATYIETVPKRGYRFSGHVEPAPQSVTVLDYEDHARERVVIEETYTPPTFKAAWAAVCAVLLAACVFTAVSVRRGAAGAHQWRSVLIQPFTAAGGADPFIASAFTQEIAARLRTIRDLRVVSPLSPVDAKDAGKRLSVETILSGRLELAGGRPRVAAQLLNADDGAVIWAEDAIDDNASDLHSALAPLASSIAARLCGRLPAAERARLERRGSTNPEAYQAFLRGQAEMLHNSNDVQTAPFNAARHLETAIRLDPGLADAWAGLARAQVAQFTAANGNRSSMSMALESAHRALSIDPSNIVARHALIRIYQRNGQHEDMLREARRVLDINAADPEAQAAAAYAYRYSGMLDRAMSLYERYLAAYPDDEDAAYQLVHACLFAKAYQRGIRHAQKLLAVQRLLFPTFLLYSNAGDLAHAVPLARQSIASPRGGTPAAYFAPMVLNIAGLHAEARTGWQHGAEGLEQRLGVSENERTRVFLAMIYTHLDRPDAAREHIRRALALNSGDPFTLFFASETYAQLGDRAAAIDALRRSVAGGFLGLQFLDYYQQEPNGWYRYREDPEFLAIHNGLAGKIADLRTRY